MQQSTLVDIIKAACGHWQDHIKDGTLPEDAGINIHINKGFISIFAMTNTENDGEYRYVFSTFKIAPGNVWIDDSEQLNRVIMERAAKQDGEPDEVRKGEQADEPSEEKPTDS